MTIAELPEIEVPKVTQGRITEADVTAVLEKWPTLTSDGLYQPNYAKKDPISHAADVYASRAELFTDLSLERISRAADWLSLQPRRKSLNPHCNSYGLKHEAERDLGEYITNGEFICAAVHLGFLIKPDYSGCINVMMNIGKGRR